MNAQFEPIFIKLVFLGAQSSGKTTLISRYITNQFNQHIKTTTLTDFFSIEIQYQNQPLKLQIWDTTEQEMFNSLHKSLYKNIDGIILCYDITNKKTFEALQKYVDQINKLEQQFSVCIVGTKSDLQNEREVEKQEGEIFAHKYDYFFEEVSAKEDTNIQKIFDVILTDTIQQKRKNLLIENDLISLRTGVLSIYSKKIEKKEKIDKKCW